MSRKEQLVVGLDLGSSKTCALVCRRGQDGKLQVAGFGMAESKGWRKSVIVNLDLTVLALKKAVETAETEAGDNIATAYVGVAGTHMKGVNSRGGVELGKTGGGTGAVTQEDILKVLQAARGVTLPPDREIQIALDGIVLTNILPDVHTLTPRVRIVGGTAESHAGGNFLGEIIDSLLITIQVDHALRVLHV